MTGMRIAVFTDTFLPQINGIATVVANIAEELGRKGHEVVIFIPKQQDIKRKKFHAKGVRVIPLPSIPAFVYPEIRLEVFGFPQIFKTLKDFRPDIIHVHTPALVGMDAILSSYIFKVPLVGTLHTFTVDDQFTWIKNPFLMKTCANLMGNYFQFFFKSCDVVLCPSEILVRKLRKEKFPTFLQYLPNAIPQHTVFPMLTSAQKERLKRKFHLQDHVVLHYGRLSAEKNIDEVLKAFSFVVEKEPHTTLLIIGDGPERARLEKLAQTLGIESHTIFTGFIDHMKLVRSRIIQVCDVFVTTSKTENQPMVALEAMTFGLPIVALKEAGMIELVSKNGFLVRSGDTHGIAEKIIEILTHPILAKRLSSYAYKEAEKYSVDHVVDQLIEKYENVIRTHQNKTVKKPFIRFSIPPSTLRYKKREIETLLQDMKKTMLEAYNKLNRL